MKDSEVRAQVLGFLYEHRLKGSFIRLPTPELDIASDRVTLICRHLDQSGLIEWKGFINGGGMTRITAAGVDIVEGTAGVPPISIAAAYFGSSHVHNHASGDGARINVNSTDQSVNVAVAGDLFSKISETLRGHVKDENKLKELQTAVAEMQRLQGQNGFTQAYQKFISLSADHIGIITPFLAPLAALLS